MIKAILTALLVGSLSGCAHVDATKATFQQSNDKLVLRIDRHLEEILHGPDIEEDQTLILELRKFQIGKRLTVPSEDVAARFDVDRSGPASHGVQFAGFVTIKSVAGAKVVANLNLTVTARTGSGNYVQHDKFKGEYVFHRELSAD